MDSDFLKKTTISDKIFPLIIQAASENHNHLKLLFHHPKNASSFLLSALGVNLKNVVNGNDDLTTDFTIWDDFSFLPLLSQSSAWKDRVTETKK